MHKEIRRARKVVGFANGEVVGEYEAQTLEDVECRAEEMIKAGAESVDYYGADPGTGTWLYTHSRYK